MVIILELTFFLKMIDTKQKFIDRLREVSLMVLPKVAVNFIVYTPTEIQNMQKQKHCFLKEEILKKGKIIYERDK